jgi:hypothetical protein
VKETFSIPFLATLFFTAYKIDEKGKKKLTNPDFHDIME